MLFPNEKKCLNSIVSTSFECESKARASTTADSGAVRGRPVENEKETQWKEGMAKVDLSFLHDRYATHNKLNKVRAQSSTTPV